MDCDMMIDNEDSIDMEVETDTITHAPRCRRIRFSTVQKICGARPSPRSKFSMVSHPFEKQLIIFGGESHNGRSVHVVHDDLFFYDIARNQWHQMRGLLNPPARSGHQMVAIGRDGGQLWLFGGVLANDSLPACDIWTLRLTTFLWRRIAAACAPPARSGHRMIAFRNKFLVVFGGLLQTAVSLVYYNDLHVFSLETESWQRITLNTSVVPQPRSDFGLAAIRDEKILLWGGHSKSADTNQANPFDTIHNDLFLLTFEKSTRGGMKCKWEEMESGVCRFIYRYGVSYAVHDSGLVYCFGGVTDRMLANSEIGRRFSYALLSFDPSTLKWRTIRTGQLKRKAAACADDVDGFVSAKRRRIAQSADNDGNDPRSHTTEPLPQIPTIVMSALHHYSTSTSTSTSCTFSCWPRPRIQQGPPSARVHAGMCICNNVLYIYGGVEKTGGNRVNTLNDLYALDLRESYPWTLIEPK